MATTTFSHEVSDGRNTVTVDFTLHSIRGPNFSLLVHVSEGILTTPVTLPDASTYLGHVRDTPGALAAGLVRADGSVLCRISFESGVEWRSSGRGFSASVRGSTDWVPNQSNSAPVPAGGAGSHVYAAEIGVDCPYNVFATFDSSVGATLELVEFSVLAANLPFLRDAAIVHRLGKVVVRANQGADPYKEVSQLTEMSELLKTVRHEWDVHLAHLVGNTHHFTVVPDVMSGRILGWDGLIGAEQRVYSAVRFFGSIQSDFSETLCTVAGYHWGSIHSAGGRPSHTPEGPTIMSTTALLSRFSSAELALILAHRAANIHILQDLGAYSFPLPPRANMDHAIFDFGEPLTIDVLANDSQSNGQALALSSLPPTSARGGMLSRTANNEVIYYPPVNMASGVDYFSYQIKDATNKTATGYVTLRPAFDNDLVAHWPLDEDRFQTIYDATINQNHGSHIGSPATYVSGHIQEALLLNGTSSSVFFINTGLDFTSNSITITGWVRADGRQVDGAGLALWVVGGGLIVGPSNELCCRWDNPPYTFNSGLALSDGVWTFVALVITSTQATIYRREDGMMSLPFATTSGTFNQQNLQAFVLGQRDHFVSGLFFRGAIDDFRVFQRALTRAEIILLSSDTGAGTLSMQGRESSSDANNTMDEVMECHSHDETHYTPIMSCEACHIHYTLKPNSYDDGSGVFKA